jgi:antitoxin (DNA-binding transcriptional repressor) of toxin-antitoxin stability system
MKHVTVSETNLNACVEDAQSEPVVLTRDGKAVAIVIATDALDEEQLALGMSDRFWSLIRSRRQERTMSRAALEERLAAGA